MLSVSEMPTVTQNSQSDDRHETFHMSLASSSPPLLHQDSTLLGVLWQHVHPEELWNLGHEYKWKPTYFMSDSLL